MKPPPMSEGQLQALILDECRLAKPRPGNRDGRGGDVTATDAINWALIEQLAAKPHKHLNIIEGAEYGLIADNDGVFSNGHHGIGEVMQEARTVQHLLDLAGIPEGTGYSAHIDARTWQAVALIGRLKDRLDRIRTWHSREMGEAHPPTSTSFPPKGGIMTKTVFVSIGNSDDKLSQREWSDFISDVDGDLAYALDPFGTVHGRWFSAPDSPWQNACWCIEFKDAATSTIEERVAVAKARLQGLAVSYRQDSIAWAEATTEFIAAEVTL